MIHDITDDTPTLRIPIVNVPGQGQYTPVYTSQNGGVYSGVYPNPDLLLLPPSPAERAVHQAAGVAAPTLAQRWRVLQELAR